MNEDELKYFRDNWKPDYDKFTYSGWKLLEKFLPTDTILDIGCGYNLFKEHLGDQVYGIDPANDCADEVVSWEDFTPKKDFNVYLCLGSLNFGTYEQVNSQVQKLAGTTHKGDRIYWRQNPGTADHPWKGVEQVNFFHWTEQHNIDFCAKYNYRLAELKQDSGDRIYAEWQKI